MVSAVSSASSASSILNSSASSSSDGTAPVQSQIAAKKAELAEAKDEAAKASIQSEIDALEAQLAKLEAAKKNEAVAAAGGNLSGESARIGSGNLSEDADFGDRYLFV